MITRSKGNHKVFAELGTNYSLLFGTSVFWIQASDLFLSVQTYFVVGTTVWSSLLYHHHSINANRRSLRMLGEVNFVARLGTSQVKLKFFVGQPLAAHVILGCDLCDSHVESFHVQCIKVEFL